MELLFIVIVFSSKVAASLLIHRLTCHKTQRIIALAIVTASVVCCFVSLMLVSVGLGSREPWLHQQDEAETVVSLRSTFGTRMPLLTPPASDPQMDRIYDSHQPNRLFHSSSRCCSSLQSRDEAL
jgi:hypothetical protein